MSQKYEHFGKYILLEKLAMGGMAEVFLARTVGASGISKFVAVKRILPQFSDNPEFRKMFQEEAKIAINLSHSNIVSLYEFGIDKGQLYIAMDYVEGRNLRQILNKMKGTKSYFSLEQALYIVKEVAAGLDHAHRSLNGATGKPLNITHRDISPQNIMVSFEGEIKIVDFGIAKAESQMEHTKTGTLKGKFGYMSPEQAEGHSTDLRTDIFSLGIVLWELIAKSRLFTANNEINTLRKIRDCQIPSLRKFNPNIDSDLEQIIMKALARDRNLRYQTAAALHRDLNRFLNRRYPDFSPQDFSVFTKTIYSDEILDTRKRLIKYANITYGSDSENEKTLVTPSDSLGASTDSENEILNLSTPTNETLSGTYSSTDNSIKKNDALEFTGDQLKENPDLVNASSKSTVRILSDKALKNLENNSMSSTHTAIRLPQTSLTNPTQSQSIEIQLENSPKRMRGPKVRINKKDRSSVMSLASLVLIFGSLIGTYTLVVREYPAETKNITTMIENVLPAMKYLHGTESQSEGSKSPEKIVTKKPVKKKIELFPKDLKLVGISINSSPSGAEIYIDGKPTGRVTPSRIDVPGQGSFKIILKKDRYLTYSRENVTAEKAYPTYNANLQKAMVAYLDIDVKPPRNARVYINGEYLKGEMLPISKYTVSAQTPLEIHAENPITGQKATAEVTLKQDERLRLVLKLKK